ncbi:SubName: Full=Uncharacterized protein {ECO:0000313/EMBL:CCA75017.1} [Serendipita indica DSM 11827]|nr:SubName: Full=Uncharacterized protein {ECO:0000313/EMBL:CCA75017.1} [Serendipita indica DSM 11827]
MPSFKPVVGAGIFIPLFGAAIWLIYGQLIAADALDVLFHPPECPNPPKYLSESQLRYTGIPALDQQLCVGVEFMKLSLFRHLQPFTIYLLSCISPAFLTLCIEALRADGPGQWFSTLGLVFSASAAGLAMPAAWLFMLVIFQREPKKPLSRPAAEAAFIAHVFGYLLPYCVMVVTMNEYAILMWTFFIFWVPIIQRLWLNIRPPTTESGFGLLSWPWARRLCYAPRTTWDSFVQWLPATTTGDARTMTSESILLQLLQWDWVFAVIPPIVAAFFYIDSSSELLGFAMIAPMLLPLAGPGALIALSWMWREWKLAMLQEAELEERRQVKEQKQE